MGTVANAIGRASAFSIAISVISVVAVSLCVDSHATEGEATESEGDVPQTYMAPPGVREEAIVVIEDFDPDDQYEMIRRGYSDQQRGIYLYNRKQYEKAYPFLLAAAQLGFKEAQARVGAIHLYGLGGVQRQHYRGMGWMAAAASGKTSPVIKRFYEDLWSQVPEKHVETLRVVVHRYVEKYSSDRLAITCRNTRHARTHVAKLRCYFDDEETFRSILDNDAYNEYYDSIIVPPDQFDSFYTTPGSGSQTTGAGTPAPPDDD